MKYIKFRNVNNNNIEKKGKFFFEFLINILSFFIPKSNPDFEKEYDNVNFWYIEFDEENEYTNREIGLNVNEEVILISPYKNNLGFWTDEDLKLEDFQKYNPILVSEKEFNNLWNSFLSNTLNN